MPKPSIHTDDLPGYFKEMKHLKNSLSRKEVNIILMRTTKPMATEMAQEAPSNRLGAMVARTTRQGKRPRAPRIGVRVGVINNNPGMFSKFTAPALASVNEYGTGERFRKIKLLFLTGKISTGKMPSRPWLIPIWDKHKLPMMRKSVKSMTTKVGAK